MSEDPELDAAWREVFEGMTAHERAGETKKRRTRNRLVQAADYVMREQGMNAKVEAIAEEAGVSVPTFYNFFHSRDGLCAVAVEALVLDQLELADRRDFKETADLLLRLCDGRTALVQAALHWMVGEGPGIGNGYFPGRLAELLADEDMRACYSPDTVLNERIRLALNMAATELLLDVAMGYKVDTLVLEDIVRLACGLTPR